MRPLIGTSVFGNRSIPEAAGHGMMISRVLAKVYGKDTDGR